MKQLFALVILMSLIVACTKERNMKTLERFFVIGIAVETTNENEQSVEDMGKLWGRFYAESVQGKIPNSVSNDIYSLYTDYETDYTGKYTSIIGLKVSSLDSIPEGMVGREFSGGLYQTYVAKGEMPNAVVETWGKIWNDNASLNRKYTVDFEVHGEASHNGAESEVKIYIAVE